MLEAEDEQDLGTTPVATDLPMGSYLCVLSHEGFPDVRYPVHVARNARWEATVRLRTEEELGEGFVLVPAGPFLYGEGRARKTVELPDFLVQRYPVTNREYAAFLDALGDEDVEERVPGTVGEGAYFVKGEDGRWGPKPDLIDNEPHASRYRKDYGEDFLWQLPVIGVSWHDAVGVLRVEGGDDGRRVAAAHGGGTREGGPGRGRTALSLGRPRGRDARQVQGLARRVPPAGAGRHLPDRGLGLRDGRRGRERLGLDRLVVRPPPEHPRAARRLVEQRTGAHALCASQQGRTGEPPLARRLSLRQGSPRPLIPLLWGVPRCGQDGAAGRDGAPKTPAPRVLRGGSWNNEPTNMRCAIRNRNEPTNRNTNIGFVAPVISVERDEGPMCVVPVDGVPVPRRPQARASGSPLGGTE